MKSEVSADFIYLDNKGIIITTNKAIATSDLNVIEKYIKELNNINSNNIMSFQLSLNFLSTFPIQIIPQNFRGILLLD